MTGGWLEDLLSCVHCGFCLPACPTYEILRDENDSPRGRIYLMRALAEQRIDADGAFTTHVSRCLGCRACETACPAGVEYGALLEMARERTPSTSISRGFHDITLAALTGPRISRLFYAMARLLRRLHIADLGARFAPGRVAVALGMLASSRRSRFASGGTDSDGASGNTTPGGANRSASGRVPETFALLQGCVMDGLYSHVHDATRRTLQRRNHEERPAAGQGCCGALHAHAGRLESARELARRNIEAFEASGAGIFVVDSAGCGAALKDYPNWLREEPEWRRRADAMAARVRDITELLAEPGDPERPADDGSRVASDGPRVAYDAPCHLLHAQGIREAPTKALSRSGYTVEPLPSWERCCGGAGMFSLQQPSLSGRVLARKMEELREGEYRIVTSGNPGCMMFLGSGLKRARLEVAVVHPVELVDAADGNAERRGEYRLSNPPAAD